MFKNKGGNVNPNEFDKGICIFNISYTNTRKYDTNNGKFLINKHNDLRVK